MRKPHIKVGALLTAAVLAMTACTGGDGNEGGDGALETLNLWVPPLANDNRDAEMWDDIVAPFEEDKGVDVDVTIVPWDAFETSYMTGVSSGEGPHVGYMYTEMIGDYIAKEQLLTMDEHVTQEQRDNFFFLDQGLVEDSQYSIPFVVGGARLLYYNVDILEEAGVEAPRTWDDLLEAGRAVKELGVTPMAANWGEPARGAMNQLFLPFAWQAGADLFEEDGAATSFTSPEMLEAVEFVKQLADEGILDPNSTGMAEEQMHQMFESGDAAFVMTSDRFAERWDEAGLNWDYVTALEHEEQYTFVASDSLVMLNSCGADAGLCYDLISHITAGDQMAKFHAKSDFPPIGRDETSIYPEHLAPIYERDAHMLRSLPVVPNSRPAFGALYSNLQQALNGSKTVEDALRDAAAEGDTGLQQGS